MKSLFRRNKGIGLVEVLITMGVLAVGVLGVAGLNSVISRQSQDNKAQAEALTIAQNRIENFRNYTANGATLPAFDALYPATQGFQNLAAITGVNATFNPRQRITDSGNNKIVDVIVAWTDADGDPQSVTLNTELSYVSPRTVADLGATATPSNVNAPTGRARLGEGTIDPNVATEVDDNQDGTKTYQDGTDLKLAEGNQVVLTLAQACQTEVGTCMDFVKIKGRVYIDTASTSRQPHEISLIASDAAYCARYYTVNGTLTPFVKNVTSKTDTPQTAPNGDYEYFDYTCYLGGGWHGNVGIVLTGGIAQSDKVCIGDPTPSGLASASLVPTIAIRRAYCGMIYKPSELANPNDNPWKFYSQGIADSKTLPYQNGHGHDFVIGNMNVSNNAGPDCYTGNPANQSKILTRTDSYVSGVKGALFQGMPNGFICLNEYPNYLDGYDNTYAQKSTCPFDPTNPPSTRFVLSGTITYNGTANTTDNLSYTSSISVNTSDGPGNCLATPFIASGNTYTATYECDVYDWVNDITSGWNGYVKPTYASGMNCTPNPKNFTNVAADSSNNNFACAEGAPGVWSGTVTQVGGNPANVKKLQNVTLIGTVSSVATNGTCTIASDGLSYTCTTGVFAGASWNGNLTITSTGGAICPTPVASSKIYAQTNQSPGAHTQNVTIGKTDGSGCP